MFDGRIDTSYFDFVEPTSTYHWFFDLLVSSPFSTHHGLNVILHVAQLVLGYVLMLIVMKFNVWLGLSVVLGLGTGYFICRINVLSIDMHESSIQLKIVE